MDGMDGLDHQTRTTSKQHTTYNNIQEATTMSSIQQQTTTNTTTMSNNNDNESINNSINNSINIDSISISTEPSPSPLTIVHHSTVPEDKSESPDVRFKDAVFSDVDTDGDGAPVGLFGIAFNSIRSKDLRFIAKAFKVRSYGQMKKGQLIESIISAYVNKDLYSTSEKTRKQRQCSYRLLNILFSDEFSEDFSSVGNVATKQELDAGVASNNKGFWVRVQEVFVTKHPIYDKLQFNDDKFLMNTAIDPGENIQCHDWKKLRCIWADLNSKYKVSLYNFTKSGNHESEFYGFCGGRLDVYYLWKHLQLKPGLNESVRAGLPAECEIESDKPVSSLATSKKSKKQHTLIAESIKVLGDKLESMEDPPELKKRKYEMLVRDEERKELEEARRAHASLVNEYKDLIGMIKDLRQQVNEEGIDDDDVADLKSDIKRLRKKKNDLASKLGYSD